MIYDLCHGCWLLVPVHAVFERFSRQELVIFTNLARRTLQLLLVFVNQALLFVKVTVPAAFAFSIKTKQEKIDSDLIYIKVLLRKK